MASSDREREFTYAKNRYLATPLAFKPPMGGFPWDDLRKNFLWMSMDGLGTKRRRKSAENFKRLSRVQCARTLRTDRGRTGEGR